MIAPSKSPAALLLGPAAMLGLLGLSISLTFQILLPIVPVMVERAGPHGIGGAATAALFFGAVTGELSSPWLMTRWRSRRLLVTGELLTAVMSLVYLVPGAGTPLMIGAAYLRGIGMGLAIVIATALVVELARPGRRGASIGYFSLALSVPGVFIPSVGVFLLAGGHIGAAAIIACLFSLVGAAAALRLPDRAPESGETSTNLLGALRRPGLAVIFAGFVLASCSFGGGLTFVPIALPLSGIGSAAVYLLVAGFTRAVGRWLGGLIVDRVRARTVLVAGVVLTLTGLIALALHSNAAVVIFAGFMYGAGYGTIQTAAYVAMLERGTVPDSAAISALWNSGIDLGSSLGGTLIGLTAARVGYAAAAWVLPGAVLLSLPLFLWPSKPIPVEESAAAAEPLPVKG